MQTNVLNNTAAFIAGNNLPADTPVPADIVLPPPADWTLISVPEAARLQIARVAAARSMGPDKITALVTTYTQGPQWGFLGEPRVNVLLLNLALDAAAVKQSG